MSNTNSNRIRAVITGIAGYVPDYILTNEELSRMVDTTDEWIMSRVGIRERHILKESGKGVSCMAVKAVERLFAKTGTKPEEVDLLVWCGVTGDMPFPATANIISDKLGVKNAFSFDINAGCSSFLFSLVTMAQFIETGRCRKIVLIGAEKLSMYVDYTDRSTCPLFGDGAAAVLIEPTTDNLGLMDSITRTDGSGWKHLFLQAGGSALPASMETVFRRQHYIHQEGQAVFKAAVSKMGDTVLELMEKNNLSPDDISWLVPHQANLRIINATGNRIGLSKEKVMINIEKYGNTSSATVPLCLWDFESQLKKGDNIILTTFGAGFTWGTIYLKWAYDGVRDLSQGLTGGLKIN
ncbi:MAG: ketoacyl-ACP synthase III [Prevotellaceae bacterium]|jgi:3-oxoacyl-[acyl-carrier-protein] synthase-3|nr:ketoacyl-ACP synthase III [Prevotellaceae bacterium]